MKTVTITITLTDPQVRLLREAVEFDRQYPTRSFTAHNRQQHAEDELHGSMAVGYALERELIFAGTGFSSERGQSWKLTERGRAIAAQLDANGGSR